jgi:hypothetical protein
MKKLYDRTRIKLVTEVTAYGLEVVNEELFHKHVYATTKYNIYFIGFCLAFLIFIIIRWVLGI